MADVTASPCSTDRYARRVYLQIITLAIFCHASFVVIYALLSFTALVVYNVCSVAFYLVMFVSARRGMFRLAVSLIHLEVCLFVIAATVLGGWCLGTHLYLIAMASLVYFCPFQRRYIPYLFSALEIAVFLALRLWSIGGTACYPAPSGWISSALYLYSACACFAIILYSAFASGLSAAVTRKALQDENASLASLADHDQLTGLLNRRAFLTRLNAAMDAPLVLAMGDVDDFKAVNDTYGHACGDFVLRELAALMTRRCGDGATLCRWGGEEFLLLFPGQRPQEVSATVSALLRDIEGHAFPYEKQDIRITMTFGLCPRDGETDPARLIRMADARLYEGKARGKNCVVWQRFSQKQA